jgi:hypothetical protein
MLALKASPDWTGAAQAMIDGCAGLPEPAQRLELFDRVCRSLGDALYPALLRVLCTVGERGVPAAQQAVASTLVDGLLSGRLPSGRLPAWGAAGSTGRIGGTRSLGPVEFLCAWYAQPDGREPLGADHFDRALRALLGLVSHDERAARLYCDKLRADADDPLGGTLAGATRHALRQLAEAWRARPERPQPAVDAFLQALQGSSLQRLRALPHVFSP